jgi:GntR family transcriptional regulator/MocR family aminotransferase
MELLLPLDREGDAPLHRQLEQQLREAVRSGRLEAGSTLPSTRALAGQLGVTRGVVVEAYEQLIAEGYLATRPGGTTRVARMPLVERVVADVAPRAEFEFDFRPGRPDVAEFPRQAWLRSMRRVLNETPAARLSYIDGHGMPELRAALAAYLNRARGTGADARDLIIAAGFAQSIQLIARALRSRGARRIAIEDPWHPEYKAMIEAAGLATVAVPVDVRGIRVELLEASGADAVVVTPAHQYPTGAVLPPDRRAALIDWADRHDATIVEDDYDSEFRYDRDPIGAIQGLCGDRVCYVGTASKVLAPGLRLAWIVSPRRLADAIATAKMNADHGSAAFDQLALADFIAHGELDRHLRRMRGVYRRRRDVLLSAVARELPALDPCGVSAGLHVLVWLPEGADEAGLVAAAAEEGIGIAGVSTAHESASRSRGLILGYGSISEHQIEAGICRLARVAEKIGERRLLLGPLAVSMARAKH